MLEITLNPLVYIIGLENKKMQKDCLHKVAPVVRAIPKRNLLPIGQANEAQEMLDAQVIQQLFRLHEDLFTKRATRMRSNMFFQLAKRPEIYAKLRQEIVNELGGRPPTYEQLRNLRYLKHCLNECKSRRFSLIEISYTIVYLGALAMPSDFLIAL